MTSITEATLRAAAEQAVARGHAIGAVLFGSRARGTPGNFSDWDICLVTDDDAGDDDMARAAALEADDPLWEDNRIAPLWIPRARFDAGVPAGSLEAAIAHEGRTLAGDTTMAKKARTVPFEAATVLRNLARASEHLFTAIAAARRHTRVIDEAKRDDIAVTMLTTSIAGAEALGRALCALTETEHTGDQRLGKSTRQIADRANEPAPPLDPALTKSISAYVEALDDSARTVRKVEYGEPGEAVEKTIERSVRGLEADLQIREGLVAASGPWAGLAKHPRRGELAAALARATTAQASMNAQEWGATPIELADEHLDGAVRTWVDGHEALADVDLQNEQ